MSRVVAASIWAAASMQLVCGAGSLGAKAPDATDLAALFQGNTCSLVEFYAPWCGHCKSLAPTYEQLGALFNGDGQPAVVKVDATDAAYEDIVAANMVRSFPTLKLFKGNGAAALDYNGDRSLNDMVQFINNHCDSDVEATEANFALAPDAVEIGSMITNNSPSQCVLLEFYAPWCGHCKNLAPTYEGLAQLFNSVPQGPRVVKIDATDPQFAQLSRDFEVRGYPTLVLVAPLDKNTGARERIQYDRRREMGDFVEFLNEECGTSVEIPANFKPKASRSQAAERAADPVLQFALKFNEYISKFKFDEGMKFGTDGLDEYPRLRTNVDKTARRIKALGYKIPESVLQSRYRFIHPTGADAAKTSLIAKNAPNGPAVTVLMHLELSSPRMKEDLLVMSKLAVEQPRAHFVGITTAGRNGALSNRDRKTLMPVVEVDDSFWTPFAFLKESWDVVVIDSDSWEIIWSGGTHQFNAHTVEHAIALATGGKLTADDEACAADSGDSSECSTGRNNDAPGVPPTIAELRTAMRKAAADLNFEKAAELRDQIQQLEKKPGQPAKDSGRHSEKPTPKPLDNENIYERDYEEL